MARPHVVNAKNSTTISTRNSKRIRASLRRYQQVNCEPGAIHVLCTNRGDRGGAAIKSAQYVQTAKIGERDTVNRPILASTERRDFLEKVSQREAWRHKSLQGKRVQLLLLRRHRLQDKQVQLLRLIRCEEALNLLQACHKMQLLG